MPWFYVDDGFPDCPKLADIPEKLLTASVGLWTLAGAWSRKKLTGGFIPAGQVRRLGGTAAEAQALVTCGLWEVVENGYRFHDWEEWQETAEEVEQKREYERTRKQAWRRQKQAKSRHTSPPCPTGTSPGQSRVSPSSPGPVQGDPSPSPSPGDPLTTFGDSSRTRTREFDAPTAEQVQRRFRALYLERFDQEPYLGGGEAVRTFAERLLGTARARGVEPLELLTGAFKRWVGKPLDDLAKRAPYAAFAGAFGSLLDGQGGGGLSEREQLQAAQAEAVKAKDMERYRSLVAEEKRRFGGGGNASAAR